MKHVKMLSIAQPAKAQEVAWVQLKDIVGPAYSKDLLGGNFIGGGGSNLSPTQSMWLATQWDNWLQK